MTEPRAPRASRRGVLLGAAGLGLAADPAAAAPPLALGAVTADLQRYAAFGDKASGGPGDTACGAWLIEELTRHGYACQRQVLDVPDFAATRTELVTGASRAAVVPQAIVTPTAGPLTGALYLPDERAPAGDIALIVLPHRRWSAYRGEVERTVAREIARGAKAAVVVTTGPTGEALALNAPSDRPLATRPVAVLAPKDAAAFVAAAAARQPGTLWLEGESRRRPAFNVVARRPRPGGRTLVLSTPRSGWFTCVGERGPGLAAWLGLARWCARARPDLDLHLVATSGHEYDNAGGARYLETLAPPPKTTALWVHLGANVAARDWHETAAGLSPLPSADPQRFLLASAEILPVVRTAFAGQPGLEAPYPATVEGSAGELTHVLAAGYKPAMGVFGAHRFHHARSDDLRCVEPATVQAALSAFQAAIVQLLPASGRRR